MKRAFCIFFVSFLSYQICINAQNIDKTKERIERLTSSEFLGRGYVDDGVNKAAEYIKSELVKAEAKSFDPTYYQEFSYNVNTFPSKLEVKIDGKLLIPGEDYIIGPETPTIKAKYELFIPDSILINNIPEVMTIIKKTEMSKKLFVIDYSLINDQKTKYIYIYLMMSDNHKLGGFLELIPNNEELIYSVRTKQQKFPVIKMKRDHFSKNSKEVSVNIKSKLIKNFETKNVIAYIEGEKDEFIVFSAHYDHVGSMGKDFYIPGAQDNASGVATLLDLVDYYSKNKPEYSIAFMFFSGEEIGLLGSKHYVENPLFDLSKIKVLINLDLVGTGDDGITVVNGTYESYKNIWNLLEEINAENNYFEVIKARDESGNSDHYYFHEKGVPAIFIYTMGGKTYYHHYKDKIETLTFAGYNQLFGLLTKFIEKYE